MVSEIVWYMLFDHSSSLLLLNTCWLRNQPFKDKLEYTHILLLFIIFSICLWVYQKEWWKFLKRETRTRNSKKWPSSERFDNGKHTAKCCFKVCNVPNSLRWVKCNPWIISRPWTKTSTEWAYLAPLRIHYWTRLCTHWIILIPHLF